MKPHRSFSKALPLALLGCMLVAAGCAKKPVVASHDLDRAAPAPLAAKPEPVKSTAAAPAPTAARTIQTADFKDVYFDLDQYSLSSDARTALDDDAKLLRDHPAVTITIEGHCDDRGTVDYNLSLGESRAGAARDYLLAAGARSTQITTISFGKERPFCTDEAESCWAKNRCSHFVVRTGPA
jgi:peptidoglycan-associated lipoprotein